MPKLSTLLSTLSLASIGVISTATASELVPKQLAGPPEEFGQMRAADPVDAVILSKSALLPIKLTADPAGAYWQGTLPVDSTHLRFMLLSGDNSWTPTLGNGNTTTLSSAARASSTQPQGVSAMLGTDGSAMRGTRYQLDDVAAGRWSLTLRSGSTTAQRGYLLLEGDPKTKLASWRQDRQQQVLGQSIALNAVLSGTGDDDTATLADSAGTISSATLRVIAPDGSVTTQAMADDGQHDDGAADDGVFGGLLTPDSTGTWLAQVIIEGTDADGQPIARSAEHVIAVINTKMQLGSTSVIGDALDTTRASLPLQISASGDTPDHYRVFAEVWGTAEDGSDVAVAWIGGMVEPDATSGALPLVLDERWIARVGAAAPYTLRNLRVEDPNHFIPVLEADSLALTLPSLKAAAVASNKVAIDESMRMGPRPSTSDDGRLTIKATGSQLILVHGYCSGGVWPESDFSDASSFLDTDQNRSHDEFAQLLGDYGSEWNSFGTVAHSQGGAAALHLYTYYWSGLDNASGDRLLQSVGTPYQGTNLAGILAVLGSWFGVGCGSNDDMTYDGSEAWLAGIPSWARAEVNYYTTSFAYTNWYTNDYCNAATDLVLDDPEDGTVEQEYGQLSGATNRGHTTGQCHTTGMRDPAQYQDSSRNAVMDAAAAR